jgi:hypothetical protein
MAEGITNPDTPRASQTPCPRCGSPFNIRVSYQGGREEYECGNCQFAWEMPATEEQNQ